MIRPLINRAMGRLTDKISQLDKSKAAGFSFSFTVFLYYVFALTFSVLIGSLDEEARSSAPYFFLSYFIPSAVIMASVFVFFKVTRYSRKDYVKFGFRPILILPVLLIFAGAYLSLSKVNDLFVGFLSERGYVDSTLKLPTFSPINYVLCIIVVGILPPVLEELLFRGIILGGNKNSAVSAVLVSAFLFSIYHMNPSKTIYQFIMGALFAFVALRTDSVLPTMIVHSLNNVAVITLQYFFPSTVIPSALMTVLIVSGAVALILGAALLFFMTKKEKSTEKFDNGRIGGFFIWASVGIALCAVLWIARLLQ